MGAVYRARDMRLERLVAVKVVRAELLQDAEARRRFRREAQLVARLQHPGIVSVFDFGTVGDAGRVPGDGAGARRRSAPRAAARGTAGSGSGGEDPDGGLRGDPGGASAMACCTAT